MLDNPNPKPIYNSAIAVANWLITMNRADPSDLTHLKIQKMLYFAQGWHLAHFDFPLFEDPIEAWKHGPVVRSVYWELKSYSKDDSITELIEGYTLNGFDYEALGTPEMLFFCDKAKDLMLSVWDEYAKQSAWDLVSITHAKDSPWDKVANALPNRMTASENEWGGDYYDLIIPIELMKSYFKKYLPHDN
ncbi:MAG: DUF4065 domain-containing protein [Deltaproteobacteria bacterium]|jgi:uncharacterized phage-associated protein|nr:DUF4065 domain-containing protein [Deltaproteobacteria bacterium]